MGVSTQSTWAIAEQEEVARLFCNLFETGSASEWLLYISEWDAPGGGLPLSNIRVTTTDDKKLQSSLKKLSVNNIPGIEEVNMIKDDGTVIHFNNPKVQASLAANTFAVTGHAENKQITEMLPGILNQLGAESLTHLKRLASNVGGAGVGGAMEAANNMEEEDDDEVPDLVENFDEVSKNETATEDAKISEVPADESEETPKAVTEE